MILTADSTEVASSPITADGYFLPPVVIPAAGRQEFLWFPDVGSTLDMKPNVAQTKFGDGYELRTSSIINSVMDKWQVQFTAPSLVGKSIMNFLKTHGGKLAFDWVTPNSDVGVFVCREWSVNRMDGGMMAISGAFEQVAES